MDEEDDDEYVDEDEDARFLDVCIVGDVDDLVRLMEEMAANGETLTKEMLNCPDNTGRVSLCLEFPISSLRMYISQLCNRI